MHLESVNEIRQSSSLTAAGNCVQWLSIQLLCLVPFVGTFKTPFSTLCRRRLCKYEASHEVEDLMRSHHTKEMTNDYTDKIINEGRHDQGTATILP